MKALKGVDFAALRLASVFRVSLALLILPGAAFADDSALDFTRGSLQSRALDTQQTVSRFAFGSCFKTKNSGHEIWQSIADTEPAFFIFAGDTLYPNKDDTSADLPQLRAAYAALAAGEAFSEFRSTIPVLPIWDDHDYGQNDGGGDYPYRAQSQALFESSWGLASDDPRVARPGLYFERRIGPPERQLQVIVLDTRSFRSPLKKSPDRGKPGLERYVPDSDPGKTMLGDKQWAWLEEKLHEPAAFRVIVSSVQILADGHGWEGWRQLPLERDRLLTLLGAERDVPLLLLSGDRHIAGFYEHGVDESAPLLEFTSSALNNPVPQPFRRFALAEAGPRRIGVPYGEPNFGSIVINWERKAFSLELHDAQGRALRTLERHFPSASK